MADMPTDLAHVLVGDRYPPRIKSGAGFRRNMRSGDRRRMAFLDLPAAALAWIGRQGTRAIALIRCLPGSRCRRSRRR